MLPRPDGFHCHLPLSTVLLSNSSSDPHQGQTACQPTLQPSPANPLYTEHGQLHVEDINVGLMMLRY